MESAFCAKWTSDLKREARSVLERAIARLALLERGIDIANETADRTPLSWGARAPYTRGTGQKVWRWKKFNSLRALIEELGRE